ncbi:hypothetical protein SH467x_000012 [Pirellulaceae bacterium SH467]
MPTSLLFRSFLIGSVVAFPALSRADNWNLKNAGVVSGTAVPFKDESSVVVRTHDGVLIQLPQTQISREIKTSEREAAYVQSMADRPDTAEVNREIARECYSRDQRTLALAHFERVVELDPNDGQSWAALGYVFDSRSGQWLPKDSLNKRLGLVVVDGKRTTLHAAELEKAKKRIREEDAAFLRELRIAFANVSKPGQAGVKAQQFLASLDDPRANQALATMLIEETKIKARARITNYDGQPYLGMLMRMPPGSATAQFIQIARELDYPVIVDPVLDALASNERTRIAAMQAFVADLRPAKTPDIEYINRAGRNLETVGDVRIIPMLIDRLKTSALVTKVNQGGAAMDKATGGISQSTGGTSQFLVTENQAGVLSALAAISGQSFGYDQDAWRTWYALTYANSNLDLRRFD